MCVRRLTYDCARQHPEGVAGMSTSERRDNIQEESTGGRRATEGHATPEDGERRRDKCRRRLQHSEGVAQDHGCPSQQVRVSLTELARAEGEPLLVHVMKERKELSRCNIFELYK